MNLTLVWNKCLIKCLTHAKGVFFKPPLLVSTKKKLPMIFFFKLIFINSVS